MKRNHTAIATMPASPSERHPGRRSDPALYRCISERVAPSSAPQMRSTEPCAMPCAAPAAPIAPSCRRISSSLHSLRVTTAGFSGIFTGATVTAPPPPDREEPLFRPSSLRRRFASSSARFFARRASSLRCLTSARTSAFERRSSSKTMKSWPSSLTQCLLSSVRSTNTRPSSRRGASMVAATQPGAPATGSISVSHDAPPVPQELAGKDSQPCGGAIHSPAGSEMVAQCSTMPWSARAIAMSCSAPLAVLRASTTSSFTTPSPRLSSLRHSTCAPLARRSHSAAISEGLTAEGEPVTAAADSRAPRAAGATGGGGGVATPPARAASIAVFFTMPGGKPNSRSSSSTLSPSRMRVVMWFTAPA
mmetsp:Transcript_6585/g.28052  ORF Transcript_6585/g.28052 Transcript_6585/m.28052 type:complete len:363 (+) Transcript_6585:2783-3871(+)